MTLGAGLMHLLDPERGRRRRSIARDAVTHYVGRADDAIDATARDVVNRVRGLVAEARSALRRDEPSDDVLEARVRSKLGHYVSHPGSIGVTAHEGRVFLSGPILAREVDPLLRAVRRIRGVRDVESRLDVHEQAGDVSGLQGGVARAGERPEFLQSHWSPAARLVAGLAGGTLALLGAGRRGPLGLLLGAAGLGLFARGATNTELRRLLGIGGGRRAVDVTKTINVDAPVERVFAYWCCFENFPAFMTNVHEVRDLGEGRSRWVVAGPAGTEVAWDAEVTRMEPNRVLAWRTLAGAAVQHAGIVHFDRAGPRTTRVHVRMSYHPPAGALGHGVAALLGSDPRTQMHQDLLRMKTFLETGQPPHDAAERVETRIADVGRAGG
jgi:uncharacterized membrane protein